MATNGSEQNWWLNLMKIFPEPRKRHNEWVNWTDDAKDVIFLRRFQQSLIVCLRKSFFCFANFLRLEIFKMMSPSRVRFCQEFRKTRQEEKKTFPSIVWGLFQFFSHSRLFRLERLRKRKSFCFEKNLEWNRGAWKERQREVGFWKWKRNVDLM